MDLDSVELAVGRGAEVIFDVARAADVGRIGRSAGELVEDRAIGLAHDVGEDVEAAAVGHSDVDLLDAHHPAIFDHRFQRRDRALAAIEPEALGPDIFPGEEFFPLLGVDHLGQDRLLAFGGELDGVVGALDPFLDEAPLLDLVGVHIFKANVAAVGRLEHLDDLAHARLLEAERAANPDRPVEVGLAEIVIGGGQVGRHVAPGEPERIEVGGEMPAHAVSADQHHCADAVLGRAADLVGRRARGRGFLGDRGLELLDRRLGRVEADVQLVELGVGQFGRSQLGPASRSIIPIASFMLPRAPAKAGVQARRSRGQTDLERGRPNQDWFPRSTELSTPASIPSFAVPAGEPVECRHNASNQTKSLQP